MKIKKILIVDENDKEYSMKLMDETTFEMFMGLNQISSNNNGFKEFVRNGNNPFIIMSGDTSFCDAIKDSIDRVEIESLINN